MGLDFNYCMEVEYTHHVETCYFTIKCIPQDTHRQNITGIEIEIDPLTPYSEGRDSFGNKYIYGRVDSPHDRFTFKLKGSALTNDEYEEALSEDNLIYGHSYGFAKPGPEIKKFFDNLCIDQKLSEYDKSIYIMNRIYEAFSYESGSTDINTTAEDAWRQGKGVCQDYSHIMIAMCHLAGIKARYVTGLMVGEGASHAWVEVLCDGKWYGMDPTNNLKVWHQYIKLGCGRDASDCQINRGIIRGDGGDQKQLISVVVTEDGSK